MRVVLRGRAAGTCLVRGVEQPQLGHGSDTAQVGRCAIVVMRWRRKAARSPTRRQGWLFIQVERQDPIILCGQRCFHARGLQETSDRSQVTNGASLVSSSLDLLDGEPLEKGVA